MSCYLISKFEIFMFFEPVMFPEILPEKSFFFDYEDFPYLNEVFEYNCERESSRDEPSSSDSISRSTFGSFGFEQISKFSIEISVL